MVFFFFFLSAVPLSASVCPQDASFPARGNFLVNLLRVVCIKQGVLCMQSCTLSTLFPNLGKRQPMHWTKHHIQEGNNATLRFTCSNDEENTLHTYLEENYTS